MTDGVQQLAGRVILITGSTKWCLWEYGEAAASAPRLGYAVKGGSRRIFPEMRKVSRAGVSYSLRGLTRRVVLKPAVGGPPDCGGGLSQAALYDCQASL